jgi:catechol 2,3-dioxygenase-like lactoylglutathione lyase family enzyme
MVKSAGPIPQHLSLVTLGVADVAAARAFYERLGFRAAAFDSADVAFFDMNGTILGLFGREALAEDAAVSAAGSGFRAVSCAFNLDSEAAVDKALAHAAACGATIVQPARKVFWGGYSGYFSDPDGHLWEIAFNPFWPLDADGRPQLPPPANSD